MADAGPIGQDALATAQLQRLNIGDDLPASEIGASLRSQIVGRNQAAIEARSAAYTTLEKQRDAIVNQRESAGDYIEALPQYKMLLGSLRAETKAGAHSPDVASDFEHILSQVTVPTKMAKTPFGGMGQDPFEVEQKAPVSFQQLDDVRRQLGEVFRGNPPEGYKAISADTARKYYGIISNIQKEFAGGKGGPQEQLLSQYSEASTGLQMFGSKAGKRATAVDRYDDTKFQTDAAGLPRQFFGTAQGVTDLIELTGSRPATVKAALDFATSELNGLSERQVREWMTRRRELLTALPEVRSAVLKYANNLQYGEQTALSAERGVGRLAAYQDGQQRMAQQRGTAIEREAGGRAAQITTQRGQEAVSLLGPKGEMFPVQNVKALIESGNSKQWELAAPQILASPGGKEMMADSIRQTLADKALESTKGLAKFFDSNVRPALAATRLMPSQDMDRIAAQLSAIENMKIPDPEKIGVARRIIMQAFAGYAASGAARGTTSLVNLIPPTSR